MANYDLTYEGSRVQGILDTGNSLKDAGYIFRGEATPSTVPGTPTERVAYIGGPGTYTNFGVSITVGAGCICVFKYTGSAWSNQVINTGLDSAVNTLQSAITAINNNIGNGYVYAGVATPSTSPVTGKVFYLAVQAGTYTNFGNAVVTAGLNVIKYNGSAWSVDQVIAIDAEPTQGSDHLVKSGGVLNSIIQNGPAFDLSAYNAQGGVLATYADLSAALTALNALPADFKKGGMSMKYVQTPDNSYIQFRCKTQSFSANPEDWEVYMDNVYVENDDIWAVVDKKKRFIALVEPDGNVRFGKIPQQITDLLDRLSDEIDNKLNNKVDKEEGKSLIPIQYITEIDDDCIVLRLDSKSRILSMIKEDGTNLFTKLDALSIGENLANQIRNAQTHDRIATVILSGLLNIRSKNVGVDALVADGTTVYFGGTGRPRLFVADFSSEVIPTLTMESQEALPSGYIKEIVDGGDYLYVCGRDNGTGLNNDIVTPLYYFPFEGNSLDNNTNVLGFDTYTHSGSATIDNTGAPAPCRFQHSAKLYKGSGTGSAILKKAISITNDGQFSLWINNMDSVITDTVYIPLLMNNGSAVLSVAIDSNNKIGLRIGEQDYFGTHVLTGAWRNVKIVMNSSNISMYVRYKECDSDWGVAVVSQSVSGITADNICVGIETQSEGITILIDDLAFDTADIDTKVAIDGFLSVVRKSDLHIMKTYKSNLRCLSMLKDGSTLYLGMIGGVNSYDISDPLNPVLIGYNRESTRVWRYPKNEETNYHYNVNGDETQRLCFMNNGSTKYLVGGSDSVGIVIYNITNPANITLYKAVRDIPQVQARVISTGTKFNSAQYIEWGVYADYPYIYSTVASLHSLHNGVNELVYPERDTVYGMKVRDISDINNIKSKIVPIPEELYNTFDVNDGDSRPTSLAKFGGQIVMGNADKGILVFSVDGMKSEWLYGKKMPNNGRTNRMFISNDGRVFATDYTATVDNPDCYIYLLRGIF